MSEKTEHSESMLVRSENLDQLLLLAGEVIIVSSNLGLVARNIQNIFDRGAKIDREANAVVRDLADSTADISDKLHKLVQSIRTVDLKDLGFRARRTVRDLARRTGKRVRVEIVGEDTVVDKSVVDKLYDPTLHLLRNAIDHGIEDIAARAKNGKPEEGLVWVRMRNGDRETVIEIEDDGGGVDMEAIRRKGVERGVIGPDDRFTEEDALNVMCLPGVSTAKNVTEVSGRGVGMDVVRSRLHELNGTVSLSTSPGKGTVFTLTIPLVSAVNIMDALVVEAAGILYAFPIASVLTTMSVPADQLKTTLGKGRMVKYLDAYIPIRDLRKFRGGDVPVAEEGQTVSFIIVEHKSEKLALIVDNFVNPQKLVIIPIDDVLPIPEIAGATLLGGRRLGYIIDVAALIASVTARARGGETASTEEPARENVTAETVAGPSPETVPEAPSPTAKKAPKPVATVEVSETDTREFVMEIERLLPALNEAFFALESDTENLDHINQAFRLAHTIKGNFMMLGLANGGETIHAVESLLDAARGGALKINADIMDVLLDGVSYMDEVCRALVRGEKEDRPGETLIARCREFLPKAAVVPVKVEDVVSGEVELSHEAYYRANIYRKRGAPLYRCYVEFDPGKQPPFLVACVIYRRFCEVGDVLGCLPRLKDIEKGAVENRMKLLFVSDIAQAELEKNLAALLKEHYGATTVELTRVV